LQRFLLFAILLLPERPANKRVRIYDNVPNKSTVFQNLEVAVRPRTFNVIQYTEADRFIKQTGNYTQADLPALCSLPVLFSWRLVAMCFILVGLSDGVPFILLRLSATKHQFSDRE
jgi:hypothetical protein